MTNFQDVLRDVHDPVNHALKTTASLTGDVEIGAVEVKDGVTDNRAVVSSTQPAGSENGLYVRIAGFYDNANLGVTSSSTPYSYYNQSSLVSGYVYYGLAAIGSNPTTANFKIQRETLNTGEVLFASGAATFVNIWSAASLASISYL